MTLPRLKPSPIPPISPTPEYLADDTLLAVYADTKAVLQVPWMGVVTMAFAHYPAFYATLWGGLREIAGSREFVDACASLRVKAEEQTARWPARDIGPDLRSLGYGDREVQEIRHQIEIFSHGNMPYLLIATAARLLLEDREIGTGRPPTPFPDRHGPSPRDRLVLIEPHHADAPTQALYGDIRETLGLPFVNTDYRALARWPSYFHLAWQDLRPQIATEAYGHALDAVHRHSVALVQGLPNPGAISSESLREAAAQEGNPEQILAVVQLFQWLLPGLVVNVAHFDRQLGR